MTKKSVEVSDDELMIIIAKSKSFNEVYRSVGCYHSARTAKALRQRIMSGPFSIDHFYRIPGKRKKISFEQKWLDRLSKEEFAALIASVTGHEEFCRAAGLPTGTDRALTTIVEHAEKLGVDTSHFIYVPRSKGKGSGRTVNLSAIMVKNSKGMAGKSFALRKALIKHNIFPNECARCHIGTSWNNKPLEMRVVYKNYDHKDLRKENLMLACPNCHDQLTSGARSEKLRQFHARRNKANGRVTQKPRPRRLPWR